MCIFCSILFGFYVYLFYSGRYQFLVVEFVSIFACHCARVSYLEEFGMVRPPSLKLNSNWLLKRKEKGSMQLKFAGTDMF